MQINNLMLLGSDFNGTFLIPNKIMRIFYYHFCCIVTVPVLSTTGLWFFLSKLISVQGKGIENNISFS